MRSHGVEDLARLGVHTYHYIGLKTKSITNIKRLIASLPQLIPLISITMICSQPNDHYPSPSRVISDRLSL